MVAPDGCGKQWRDDRPRGIGRIASYRKASRLCWRSSEGSGRPASDGDTTMSIEIAKWLHSLGLARYSEAFAGNAIDWEILPS